MQRRIDSNYEIAAELAKYIPANEGEIDIKIRNVFNGNEIPEDEPTVIFRAKDRLARVALRAYYDACKLDGCTKEQLDSLAGMLNEFDVFAINNPDKMKQPGSTMPEDMKKRNKHDLDVGEVGTLKQSNHD